jgi:murein DD-endopeptidase MepM/ murein hydrolase activator NlpD
MLSRKNIIIATIAILITGIAILFLCTGNDDIVVDKTQESNDTIVVKDTVKKYGLPIEEFDVAYDTVRRGQTVAEIFMKLGFSARQIYEFTQCPDSIFNERRIRVGNAYALLSSMDSTHTPQYFIYEDGPKEYVKFDFTDSVFKASREENPSHWQEMAVAGTINTSLWVSMQERGASPLLAVELSHIFGWTVDFFGIQAGDSFRVLYEQEFIGDTPINNQRIIAASFTASGKTFYAIPYTQDGEELYYNIDGNSLEGAFLKAPLDYYRISSRFSNSRFHPVLKRYRAHHGVDYAAPKGTPVYAIGSGKVIAKAYQAGGGGNYVKIRHNSVYVTTYMHLSGFAKGLKVGDYVKQKQVIGYVGSTGLSTGPHLDFRVYENGKAINPLTLKSQPKKPISKENMDAFKNVCDSLVQRLRAL